MSELSYHQQVSRHFSRAAAHYQQHHEIQQYFGQLLLSRKQLTCRRLLDVGCGPAAMYPALTEQCTDYIGLDLSPAMLQQAARIAPHGQWLQGAAENLPLPAQSIDFYFANLSLQWSESLQLSLQEMQRVLSDEGEAAFNLPIAGSFHELQESFRQLDEEPHTQSFFSMEQLNGVIEASGLRGYQYHIKEHQQWFPDLKSLLRSIKGVGANYVKREQGGGLLSPRRFNQVIDAYECYRTDKGLPLTWRVASVHLLKQVNL
ncbi:MAG: methyltransferase domain-containing protein [Pseudomonadota bacterium]